MKPILIAILGGSTTGLGLVLILDGLLILGGITLLPGLVLTAMAWELSK